MGKRKGEMPISSSYDRFPVRVFINHQRGSSLYGITLDAGGIMMTRFLGACLIGIGLICWLDREADPEALQGITLALCIGDTVGFLVALLGQLSGLLNALGWVNVVIWLLLALGLGYFRFLKPSAS
jgi:hypothetical protein